MKKLPTPSSLTVTALNKSTVHNPIRVCTKGFNMFDVSKTSGAYPYIIRNVSNGSHFGCDTLKEVKYFISCFL